MCADLGILVFVNGGQTVVHDVVDLDNQVLVFKVNLPKTMDPLVG